MSCMKMKSDFKNSALDKERSKSLVICVGLCIVVIGCFVLHSVMSEEGWSQDVNTQHRVVVLALILLLTSVGLCYFAMKSTYEENDEESLRIILVRPTNYSSTGRSAKNRTNLGRGLNYWTNNCVLVSSSRSVTSEEDRQMANNQSRLLGLLNSTDLPRVHGIQANG